MKVIYVGNYRDGTGWGNSCLTNIIALDSAGVDVVPRCIKFKDGQSPVPAKIDELEKRSGVGADVCVYHTLPPLYSYNGNLKNIGLYYIETLNFEDSLWQKYINMMDEAWVASDIAKTASFASGVKTPIKIAPCAIDYKIYDKFENDSRIDELEDTFNFCFIGEFTKRKNIQAMMQAFHTEFHPSEPVNLVIKTNIPGTHPQETFEIANKLNNDICNSLKIRKNYKQPLMLTGHVEQKQILSILSHCHAFVAASYGEGWCIPALEAMALGKPVIFNNGISLKEFAVGYPVSYNIQPCAGAVDTIDNLYTADSYWCQVNVSDLAKQMRNCYNDYLFNNEVYLEKCKDAKERAKQYDYKVVGETLKGLLNDS